MFAGEFYTGSKVGVHTCLRRVLYWFKGRSSYYRRVLYWFKGKSSYLCGGEFYTGSKTGVHTRGEFYTGSKVGVHTCLGTSITQVQR